MTWKTGDTVSLPIYLETTAGVAVEYADETAFTTATWAITWLDGASDLASQPTYTLAPDADAATTGAHAVTFALPSGVTRMRVTVPAGFVCSPIEYLLNTGAYDATAVAALINTSAGTLTSADRVTQYDWDWTENDSFLKEMTVPAAALTDFGYADLSAAGWSAACAVRETTDTTAGSPAATLTASVTDGADNLVTISSISWPAGLALAAADIAIGYKLFYYDVQLVILKTLAITAVSTGSKTFTVSGDQVRFFNAGQSITVTGSTGNNGTYPITVVALVGGNTVITTSATVPDATVDGSVNSSLKITPIRGTITVRRQEVRTP